MPSEAAVPVEPNVEDIRHQIEETRTHLGDQMEALEHGVMDIVHDATATVTGTIDRAKEAVGETVDAVQEVVKSTTASVKHALDIRDHVRRHPWLMAAGAFALGYVCAGFLLRRR